MKSVWPWFLSGICLVLICWCNLNTYFINQNTEKIEKLEKKEIETKIDTFFIPVIMNTTYKN